MNEEKPPMRNYAAEIWSVLKRPVDNRLLISILLVSNFLIVLAIGWVIVDTIMNPDSDTSAYDTEAASMFGTDESATDGQDSSSDSDNSTSCNVAGINLHGQLVTYISNDNISDNNDRPIADQTASESILTTIQWAEQAENIKAIVMEVDSYGGSPVAGKEIADALKNSKKPVIAYIRDAGDSASYLAATGASTIFASAMSDVGGMGITMSYLDGVAMNKKEGLNYNQLSIGKFKDTGSSDKPLTAEEKKLLMEDLQRKFNIYLQTVATNRKMNLTTLTPMANGLTYNGDLALQMGLIDKIGGYFEVNDYVKTQVLGGTETDYCWY